MTDSLYIEQLLEEFDIERRQIVGNGFIFYITLTCRYQRDDGRHRFGGRLKFYSLLQMRWKEWERA